MRRSLLQIVGVLLSVFLCSSAWAVISYSVTDLGPGVARSINNNGQIVGQAYNYYAVLFDSSGNGNTILLGRGNAYSINNGGQIVGDDSDVPILFDATGHGHNVQLGRPMTVHGGARSINNSGQIAGHTGYGIGPIGALYYATATDTVTSLGGIFGGGIAYSINDNQQIVGYSTGDWIRSHAILFDPTGSGNNTDLGTLGGASGGAYSINNSGQIVGWAFTNVGWYAALFDSTGAGNNINLGSLGDPHGYSIAWSVNNNGQIVGEAENYSANSQATLFDPTGNGNNVNLNSLIDSTLGWNLTQAYCINDNGWIVGRGINPQGQSDAFLLKPVPEPATLLLFVLGSIGFLYRKKQ